MKNIIITGANRGIGFEFAKQYAAAGNRVWACTRNLGEAAKDLEELQKHYTELKIIKLDVTSENDRAELVETLQGIHIDLLINCAGIKGSNDAFATDPSTEMQLVFTTNTIAPLLLSHMLSPNLARSQSGAIVSISSERGSISLNNGGSSYSYRASKAALNMVMKSLAIEMNKHSIKVMVLHPGWVQTQLGGPGALISPEQSVKGMRNVIANKIGTELLPFYTYNGEKLDW